MILCYVLQNVQLIPKPSQNNSCMNSNSQPPPGNLYIYPLDLHHQEPESQPRHLSTQITRLKTTVKNQQVRTVGLCLGAASSGVSALSLNRQLRYPSKLVPSNQTLNLTW